VCSITIRLRRSPSSGANIFNNPVRFVGEPVAAVAATDRHMAEETLARIVVDYEVLPHVLDPEEALKPGARNSGRTGISR
jgi:CO/xanthine dehydrogenase Mo-binding subunit